MPNKQIKILLVDDSKQCLITITSYLNSLGFTQIETAANGTAALKMLVNNESKFDLIISDVQMPEMNGLELLTAIKSNKDLESIPVIIMSFGYDYAKRARELGALFVPKTGFIEIVTETKINNMVAKD